MGLRSGFRTCLGEHLDKTLHLYRTRTLATILTFQASILRIPAF